VLTTEQREIRDLARDFVEGEIVPRAATWDRDRAFDREVLDKLAELGFLGMLTPVQYGGLGFDAPTYLVALQEIARGDAALALTVAIQNGPVPHILLTHGSEDQKTRWLPALASGEKISGFALSEADAGSDPSGMLTRARSEDGIWTVSGSKKWVTNGSRADVVIVFARTGPAESRSPVGAFLVDTDAEGYRVGRREKTMGLRASETVSVDLEGVRLGTERLVGDPGRGIGYALGALDLGRLGIGAQAVGIAQAALEHASRYAGERRQFGRPIGSFQALQHRAVNDHVDIELTRSLIYQVCAALDEGRGNRAMVAAVKARASDAVLSVTKSMVQMHGAIGFTKEHDLQLYTRRAKVQELGYGDANYHKELALASIESE